MKVLKNNYNNTSHTEAKKTIVRPYPREWICEDCDSELSYEENDLTMGALGCVYLRCPCCGYENVIEDNENVIDLTKDNVEFPTHFFHTSKEMGAKECCNNTNVKECIQRAIEYFRRNKEEYQWYTQTGDMYLNVNRYDGDESYEVIVSNNYYNTYIPFENEDY